MIELTKSRVLELLDEAVAERGADYVYPRDERPGHRCVYVYNDQPDCIVGYVLSKAGVDLDTLHTLGDLNPDNIGGTSASELIEELEITAEGGVVEALSSAQTEQDAGLTWGESAQTARQVFSNMYGYDA